MIILFVVTNFTIKYNRKKAAVQAAPISFVVFARFREFFLAGSLTAIILCFWLMVNDSAKREIDGEK